MAKAAKTAKAGKTVKAAKTAKAANQRVVITLSGDRPIREVAADLRAAGLDVDHVLEAIGSVTGSSHSRNMKRLRQVRGVADVSPDHPVDIGPPGAPVS
jgi:3-hydroxyisobutyrate dehydrogenase-like beta-hydroxyacid dehydrogenase